MEISEWLSRGQEWEAFGFDQTLALSSIMDVESEVTEEDWHSFLTRPHRVLKYECYTRTPLRRQMLLMFLYQR